MSNWTHNICEPCWEKRHPGRTAVRMLEPEKETCCFCGDQTYGGIYVREDPANTKCNHEGEGKSDD
jgi:hypothetical protein